MRKSLIFLLLASVLAGVAACQKKPDASEEEAAASVSAQAETESDEEWRKYIYQIGYEETSADGTCLTLNAYYSSQHCVIHIDHPDGSQQLFYTDADVLYALKDYNDAEQFTAWGRTGPDTPELDREEKIRVTCTIESKSKAFGTNHMPDPDGLDKLHKIRDMLLDAAKEEDEIPPFTVTIGDKTYQTVRGTGNIVGTGAIIDFGEEKWWQVEQYVGHFVLEEDPESTYVDISDDGTIHVFDRTTDTDLTGRVNETHGYAVWAEAVGGRVFLNLNEDDLQIQMSPDPYPGTFEGMDYSLTRK